MWSNSFVTRETTDHGREKRRKREESMGEVIEPMSCNNSKI